MQLRANHDHDVEFVRRRAAERRVRFVRLWFVDVLGLLKSVAVPVSELDRVLEHGVGIDGSALEGTARIAERDLIAHPDPATFQVLPWRPDAGVARMLCDVRTPDGLPAALDSRHVLRRTLAAAADAGLTMQAGAEVEFFLFEPLQGDGPPVALDDGRYFDLTAQDVGSDFRRRTIDHLEHMGIPVKASHHEAAPSQHEVDLHHADPLSLADALMTFRVAVREVARESGVHATFMPQPLEGVPGSGLHLHVSLYRRDRNAFHDDDDFLSPTGQAFLAGVLAHAGELTAITNQWINSYRRLVPGFEAPEMVAWTRTGRSALVRIPSGRPDRPDAARIELRSPDPGANPYLALAMVLGAGLRGLERDYALAPEDVPSDGVTLPVDLREATDRLEESELAADVLGDRMLAAFVRNKRADVAEHRRRVSDAERGALLRVL